jgi:crossover junction endodeoxyribonuclease RuvC
MNGRVLGIDPGATAGGWAVLNELGQIIAAGDLPIVGNGAKAMVSGPLLADLVLRFAPSRAVVERVGPMPKQGVSSTFKFGRGVGLIEGVLGGGLVPISSASPPTRKRRDERPSRFGRRRLPSSSVARGDHGRAEAALIALWSQRAALAADEALRPGGWAMTAPIQPLDPATAALTRRVLLELRHARIRCDLAIVELDWAALELSERRIAPQAALSVLDDAMNELTGVQP